MSIWNRVKSKAYEGGYFFFFVINDFLKDLVDILNKPKFLMQLLIIILAYQIYTDNQNAKYTGLFILLVYLWKKKVEGNWMRSMRQRYKDRMVPKSDDE